MTSRLARCLVFSASWWVGSACCLRAAADGPRPHVVIVANNSGAETTDLLTPYAILKDAGVADVEIVASEPGPVRLMPGLVVEPDATLADVATTPDVVIVPAMHDPSEPTLLAALRRWSAAGAMTVSICDGAWVLADAGLLDGRRATSHWYSLPTLRERFPRTRWRQDVRWVRDGPVLTSAGVSASEPVSRYLATLLRNDRTLAGAGDGPPHDGAAFRIGVTDVTAGAMNYALPWRWDVVTFDLPEGFDELALAFNVDLLQRTYAVRTATAGVTSPLRGRRGLRVIPDVIGGAGGADHRTLRAPATFDALLSEIEQRYGRDTRSLVALQIEYAPAR